MSELRFLKKVSCMHGQKKQVWDRTSRFSAHKILERRVLVSVVSEWKTGHNSHWSAPKKIADKLPQSLKLSLSNTLWKTTTWHCSWRMVWGIRTNVPCNLLIVDVHTLDPVQGRTETAHREYFPHAIETVGRTPDCRNAFVLFFRPRENSFTPS